MSTPRHAPMSRPALPFAAMIATAGALAGSAAAEIAWSTYMDDSTYAFIVQDMPDFDQIRSVLPNTGNCYCGPASTIDLLGYVATHGYPDVDPGIPLLGWHTATSYNEISTLMASVGVSTAVSPGGSLSSGCGTSQNQLHEELVDRIGDRFTVRNCLWNTGSGYAPDTAEVAYRGWRDQAVGLMLYGRWAGVTVGGQWVSNTRRGGHFEAVNRAIAGGGLIKLGLRNPVSDDVNTAQSAFETHWFDVTRRSARINGNVLTVDQLNGVYSRSIDTDGDGAADTSELRMRIFEGYLSISPKACYTWDDVTSSIIRLVPEAGIWSPAGIEHEAIELPGLPRQVAFGPSDLAIASIVDGKVIRTNRAAGRNDRHLEIDIPFDGWFGAKDLAFDEQRRLHVVGGDRLVTIDWNRGEVVSEVRLPGEGTSLAIENGIVHVLVPEMDLVAAINQGPNGPFVIELPLPDDAMVAADSTIDMLPGGRLFLLTEGSVNPMQITDQGFQRLWLPVPRDGDWQDIQTDDRDTLCMLDQDGRVEAYRVGRNGFDRDDRHPLDGVFAGKGLAVARSTSNWTPEMQAWVGSEDNFDDRAVELDCPGDLDFNGRVDSADMGLLLGMWGEERSIADLDRSGLVDSADLGLLLGHFGDCP